MAFREVTMVEVKEILRLWLLGLPKKRIAQHLGFDIKTVRRYLAAAKAQGLHPGQEGAAVDDARVAAVLGATGPSAGRPRGPDWARCAAQHDVIAGYLTRGVRLTKVGQLLRREGIAIPYPTLRRYALTALAFGGRRPTVPVADGPPGGEVQVDTGWMGLLEPDAQGRRRRYRAWIFTAVRSRHRFVWPAFQETTAAAIDACEAAWAAFGGIFRVLVVDNTKALIVRADPLRPTLTPVFLEYAQARGFIVDPARVRAPRDKARVERAVATVRDDCFGGERFRTLEAARAHARHWAEATYGQRRHRTTLRCPHEHFVAEEQPVLLPAPTQPYDLPRWSEPTVGPDQFAVVAGALYSLPLAYRRQRLTARADAQTVRFYAHEVLLKVHARQPAGRRAIDPADFPAASLACAQRDAAYFVREATAFGPAVGTFATALVAGPAPWTRFRQLFKLLGLGRKYGGPRLEAACQQAVAVGMIDVFRLADLLRLDAPVPESPPARRPDARYLRPASHFALPLGVRDRAIPGDAP